MIVVNRFRGGVGLADELAGVLGVLAAQAGYVDGEIGRNLDEPDLFVLLTRWADVGSYLRALSSYDVKVGAVAVLGRAIDEASAYEPVGDGELNHSVPRDLG